MMKVLKKEREQEGPKGVWLTGSSAAGKKVSTIHPWLSPEQRRVLCFTTHLLTTRRGIKPWVFCL